MFGRNKRKNPPSPYWLRMGILLFVLFGISKAYQANQMTEKPEAKSDEKLALEHYPAVRNFFSATKWRQAINPAFGTEIQVLDEGEGKGDFAECGQKVVLRIEAAEETSARNDLSLPAMPLTLSFTIGDGSVHTAWDRAVRGLKPGVTRQAAIGARLFDPSVSPKLPAVIYQLRLQEIAPHDTHQSRPFEVVRLKQGMGIPASCGDDIRFFFRLRDKQEKLIYESKEADDVFTLTIGKGEWGHGIDRGVIGMKPLEIRRFYIPKAYYPKQSPIAFPKDDFAIVELHRLAYKKEDAPEKDLKDNQGEANVTDR